MKKIIVFLIFAVFVTSCGTKTIKETSIQLSGTLLFKYHFSNTDSIVNKGTHIKMDFAIPESITTADGIVINNIVKATFGQSPMAHQIDSFTNTAYKNISYNFIKGNGD